MMPNQPPEASERLGIRDLSTWLVLAPAIALVLLGILFIVAPRTGAAVFGIPAPEGSGLAYVAAIGVRDVAFGLFVLTLALLASRRAVGLVLAVTVLIPTGDILIVVNERGLSSPGHLLLHGASGAYMAAAALWVLRLSRQVLGPDRSGERT
jgi:hypothetical protein